MPEETNEASEGAPASTAVAIRPARTPVTSHIAIMDTARFEHLGRVATVMANAGLMPESLTHTGNKNNRVPLPMDVVQARAFLIAAQADRWGMDPTAVMGCCSLVHNKLMYEGKLVNAVIEARTGVKLQFEYGKWDPATLRVKLGVAAADESLGVVVSGGSNPDTGEVLTVEGYVGLWRTTGDNSPWTAPGNWRRQLRYRGSREWANAHEPGVVLGVLTDDDVDIAPVTAREVPSLASPNGDAKTLKPKGGGGGAAPAAKEIKAEPGTVVLTEELGKAGATIPAEVQHVEVVLTGGAGSAVATEPEQEEPEAIEGPAPAGVRYGLQADEADADDTYPVYVDGAEVTRVPSDEWADAVYTEHAPKVEVLKVEPKTTRGRGAKPKPVEGQVEVVSLETALGAKAPDTRAIYEMSAAYSADLAAATTWSQIQTAVGMLNHRPEFKGAPEATQATLKAQAVAAALKLPDPPDPRKDVRFYLLWIDTATADDAALVFPRLMRTADYGALEEDMKDQLCDKTDAAKARKP
jgi:hypothetical protein